MASPSCLGPCPCLGGGNQRLPRGAGTQMRNLGRPTWRQAVDFYRFSPDQGPAQVQISEIPGALDERKTAILAGLPPHRRRAYLPQWHLCLVGQKRHCVAFDPLPEPPSNPPIWQACPPALHSRHPLGDTGLVARQLRRSSRAPHGVSGFFFSSPGCAGARHRFGGPCGTPARVCRLLSPVDQPARSASLSWSGWRQVHHLSFRSHHHG